MLTFIDWFAGIGGFRRGMELAGHRCVGFCEFDKYAVASYTSMHLITDEQRKSLEKLDLRQRQKEILKDEYRNGEWYANDVTRVIAEDIPRADVWCFGFPCQDISVAGKQRGFKGNRSSLFFRITGLIRNLKEEDKPSMLFIENVKNLLSVNGGWDFARVLVELDEIGYDAEWEVLNSKDFGVPHNRERIFIIGHLRGRGGRKVLPLPGDSRQTGAEIKVVGETGIGGQRGRVYSSDGISGALSATDYKQPKQVKVEKIAGIPSSSQRYQVYDTEGLSPTLDTAQGGGNTPSIRVIGTTVNPNAKAVTCNKNISYKVAVKEATKKGYAEAQEGDSINLSVPGSETRRGRVGKGIANTLDTGCQQGTLDGYRIRRLTPKECFRLQGWTDDYFEKAEFVNTNRQLYKQAGNGVTVTVIEAIANAFAKEDI